MLAFSSNVRLSKPDFPSTVHCLVVVGAMVGKQAYVDVILGGAVQGVQLWTMRLKVGRRTLCHGCEEDHHDDATS